jgi:tryptophan synthase beta chain
VVPVTAGAGTLKDAMNEALRDWVANVHDTFYIIGTAAGPHPYPELVRDFQSVIGREARADARRTGRLPDLLVAAIGGGSNAIGLFHPFLDDPSVKMLGVEAAATGWTRNTPPASPAAARACSTATRPICCRTRTARSPRPLDQRLDYPGIGPEHAWLRDIGRVEYLGHRHEALEGFQLLCRTEGIIPALEPPTPSPPSPSWPRPWTGPDHPGQVGAATRTSSRWPSTWA